MIAIVCVSTIVFMIICRGGLRFFKSRGGCIVWENYLVGMSFGRKYMGCGGASCAHPLNSPLDHVYCVLVFVSVCAYYMCVYVYKYDMINKAFFLFCSPSVPSNI